MSATVPGKIPCPSCGAPLPLPVEAVLAGRPIDCRFCGLELTVRQEASQEALDALARWHEETADARAAAAATQATQPEAASQTSGRRKRRPRRQAP